MCGLFNSRPQFKARGLRFMTSAKVSNFFYPLRSPLSFSHSHNISALLSTFPLPPSPLEWGSHKWKIPNNANRNLNSLSCIANSKRGCFEKVTERTSENTHVWCICELWVSTGEEMNLKPLLCGFSLLIIGALSVLILQSAVVPQVLIFISSYIKYILLWLYYLLYYINTTDEIYLGTPDQWRSQNSIFAF